MREKERKREREEQRGRERENGRSRGCLAGVQESKCFILKQGKKGGGKEINGEGNGSITVK